jgi:type IV secretory pathway TrbL component
MNHRLFKIGTFALAAALSLSTAAFAATPYQDGTKHDMKSAGHETKDAAVDTGHGIKTGTRKAYHKTKHGVKKAYHKTAKTLDPHANSQDPHHQ